MSKQMSSVLLRCNQKNIIATYFEKGQLFTFVERTLAVTGVSRPCLFHIYNELRHDNRINENNCF